MAKLISSLAIRLSLAGDRLKQGVDQSVKSLGGLKTATGSAGRGTGLLSRAMGALGGSGTSLAATMGLVGFAVGALAAAYKSLTGIINGVRAAFVSVDDAAKKASNLGTTITSMEALGLAAERGGSSLNEIETALGRMLDTVGEAVAGTAEAKDAFDELGLSADDLSKLTADEQMVAIATALQGVETTADRVRLSMDIFGRQGRNLQTTLASLAESGMAPLREEMKELGNLSEEDADAIEEMNDAWTEFQTAVSGVFKQIAASVAPVLEDLLREILIPMLKTVIDLVKWWRELFGADPEKIRGSMDEIKKSTEAAAASASTWAKEQERIKELAEATAKAEKEAAAEIKKLTAEAAKLEKDSLKAMENIDSFRRRATSGAVQTGTSAALNVVANLRNAARDRAEEERRDRRKALESATKRERRLEEIRARLDVLVMKPPVKTRTHRIVG